MLISSQAVPIRASRRKPPAVPAACHAVNSGPRKVVTTHSRAQAAIIRPHRMAKPRGALPARMATTMEKTAKLRIQARAVVSRMAWGKSVVVQMGAPMA